jgi:hypothetical protein
LFMAPAGCCTRVAGGCPTGGAAGALGAGDAAGVAVAALGPDKEEPPVMNEGMGSDSGAGALDRPAHLACEGTDGAAAGAVVEGAAAATALGAALAALLLATDRTAALAAEEAAKAADTAALRASSLLVCAA